jgi:hypothetical protein
MDAELVTQTDVSLVISKVEALFNKLGEQIGVGAEHFWPIMVRQQQWTGIIGSIAMVGAFALAVALFVFWCRKLAKLEWNPDANPGITIAFVFTGIAVIGIAIAIFVCASCGITMIFNPEYWALEDLIERLR